MREEFLLEVCLMAMRTLNIFSPLAVADGANPQFKVCGAVVVADAVDVVYRFALAEGAAKCLLHDNSVFCSAHVINSHEDIALLVDAALRPSPYYCTPPRRFVSLPLFSARGANVSALRINRTDTATSTRLAEGDFPGVPHGSFYRKNRSQSNSNPRKHQSWHEEAR